jgi:hypothetical protein
MAPNKKPRLSHLAGFFVGGSQRSGWGSCDTRPSVERVSGVQGRVNSEMSRS